MTRPVSSVAFSSSQTSNASMVPPGKRWPTSHVRTTTSTRTDSPRRTRTGARPKGPRIRASGSWTAAPGSTSSEPEKEAGFRLSAAAAATGSVPPASLTANTSTETFPACRNSCVIRSWVGWLLAVGRAVLAAMNRCERTRPPLAAGSSDSTFGMWQSTQVRAALG